jgi:hypothetical protein
MRERNTYHNFVREKCTRKIFGVRKCEVVKVFIPI